MPIAAAIGDRMNDGRALSGDKWLLWAILRISSPPEWRQVSADSGYPIELVGSTTGAVRFR